MKDIINVGNISLYVFDNYAVIAENGVFVKESSQIQFGLDDISLDYSIGRESFDPKAFSGINYTVNNGKILSKSVNNPSSKVIGFFKYIIGNILPQMNIEFYFTTRDENGKAVQRTYTSEVKRNIGPLYIGKIKRVKDRIDKAIDIKNS